MSAPAFHHADAGTPESAWLGAPGWDRTRTASADELLDGVRRLVVLAAHPDDETLGAGGLTASAAARGVAVDVVVATDGEASHPDSVVRPATLAALRRDESRSAAARLGGNDVTVTFLGLGDGTLDAQRDGLAAVVRQLLERDRHAPAHAPGAVLVACPWEHDGHPDHEALGAAAREACGALSVPLLRYPIWGWQWGLPDDFPWDELLVVPLDAAAAHAKHDALAAHATQVAPLVAGVDPGPLLSEGLLRRHRRLVEAFVVDAAALERRRTGGDAVASEARDPDAGEPADAVATASVARAPAGPDAANTATSPPAAKADPAEPDTAKTAVSPAPAKTDPAAPFDAMYDDGDDPWHDDAFYERRKRALVLACLGRERYGRVLEIGCATGTLGAELATRTDAYVGLDGSARALSLARARHGGPGATFVQGLAPGAVPEGPFDLVVLSEVGYFLRAEALLSTLRAARAALADGGEILLCHWRHPTRDIPLDGPLVHGQAAAAFDLPHRVAYRDDDVLVDVWGAGPSVAARDGLA